MSNSSMVVYTNLSPNIYGKRTHKIDTITIHCMAFDGTVERCGAVFAKSGRASSNYGIGSDGRVGLYVDEANASCASSNKANDERAVTIEVACKPYHPYEVTGAAYESLVKLCADICQRNGIKELKWQGNKSLIGKVDQQNMTVHRWFKNKACPGDYLYNRHGDIAKRVNELLNGPVKPSTGSEGVDVYYRVRSNGKWLPEVKNLDDYAGLNSVPITALTVKVSKGTVKYRAHTVKGAWLPYVTGCGTILSSNYAGNCKDYIDAIEVYYYTPDNIRPYKCAKYRVAPVGGKFYSWQIDDVKSGDMDGYAGCFGSSVSKVQIVIE